MTDRRSVSASDGCIKCGQFPQPRWRPVGCDLIVPELRSMSKRLGVAERPEEKVDHEHLLFICPCGFSWETPTRDAPKKGGPF